MKRFIMTIIIMVISFIVFPAIKYFVSDDTNNCMEEYIRAGAKAGYIFNFDRTGGFSYDIQSYDSKYLSAVRQHALWVGYADGCIMHTDSIVLDIFMTDQCLVSKFLFHLNN